MHSLAEELPSAPVAAPRCQDGRGEIANAGQARFNVKRTCIGSTTSVLSIESSIEPSGLPVSGHKITTVRYL